MSPLFFSMLVLVIGAIVLWAGLRREDGVPLFGEQKYPVLSLLESLLYFAIIWLGFGAVLAGAATTLFLLFFA